MTKPTEFAQIGLSLITPSLTNPRKHFNAARLEELAASIKASGVHQPVLVRFLPGHRTQDTDREVIYELVAGERRLRASIMAGVDTIPAMIRPLNDSEVLEIQIVENLQRDDLSELEEAEGYDALMQHASLNADQVADKIGKSRSYVYGRLKLLDLCPAAKQGLREGQIDASRAILIARIPDTQLQEKALKEAGSKNGEGTTLHSTRSFGLWLQQNVMLPLDKAPFDITSTTLAGYRSCKECPKRTGAAPDIFQDVIGADICTDPPCYHRKANAHIDRLQAMAAVRGAALIHGKEAAELCNNKDETIKGYSPLTQMRYDTISGQPATLLELLVRPRSRTPESKAAEDVALTLVENPFTRQTTFVVGTMEAERSLLALGLIKAPTPQATKQAQTAEQLVRPAKSKGNDLQARTDRLLATIAEETDDAWRTDAWEALKKSVHASGWGIGLITAPLVRAWLDKQIAERHSSTMAKALNFQLPERLRAEGEKEAALVLHAASLNTDQLYKAMALLMICSDTDDEYHDKSDHGKAPAFAALAQTLKVDLDTLRDQAGIKVKAQYAAHLQALKDEASTARKVEKASAKTPAKVAQSDLPLAPAAQASGVRGGGSGQRGQGTKLKTHAGPAGARARSAHLSQEEAQLGIAAAMQGLGEEGAPAAGQDETANPDAGVADVGEARPTAEALPAADVQSGGSAAELKEGHSEAGKDAPRSELFQRAADLVRKEGKVNQRMVKAGLSISTDRAGAIIRELEAAGIVSSCNERGARQVVAV